MTTNDDKSTMDDSTLKSSSPSFDEKVKNEAGESIRQGSRSPSPAPSIKNEHHDQPDLKKVNSAKEASAELTKIMTSGEGVEYPTGLKLGLSEQTPRGFYLIIRSLLEFECHF